MIERRVPLPSYTKHVVAMDAENMEVLTRRVYRLSKHWDSGNLRARSVVHLDQPRSVTWLRIVSGRWLFVASSDSRTSGLSCWDIEDIFNEMTGTVAECFFSGAIHDAEVEVQDGSIVVASSVDSRWVTCHVVGPIS